MSFGQFLAIFIDESKGRVCSYHELHYQDYKCGHDM